MRKYVLCVAETMDNEIVVLKKSKPSWQAGVEDIIDHDRTVEIVVDQKHLASKEAYENVENYVKMLKNYGIVCK